MENVLDRLREGIRIEEELNTVYTVHTTLSASNLLVVALAQPALHELDRLLRRG